MYNNKIYFEYYFFILYLQSKKAIYKKIARNREKSKIRLNYNFKSSKYIIFSF